MNILKCGSCCFHSTTEAETLVDVGDEAIPVADSNDFDFGALTFHVELERSEGEKLGIAVKYPGRDKTYLPVAGITGGLIAKWNAENASHRVKEGDIIVEVNGRGDVNQLLERFQHDRLLCLVVTRSSVDPSL